MATEAPTPIRTIQSIVAEKKAHLRRNRYFSLAVIGAFTFSGMFIGTKLARKAISKNQNSE